MENLNITEKLALIYNNLPKIYNKWQDNIYIDNLTLNDNHSLELNFPFNPDKIYLISFDAIHMSTPLTYNFFAFDNNSFSKRAGFFGLYDENLTNRQAFLTNQNIDNYIQIEENKVIFSPPSTTSYFADSRWRSTGSYFIFAYRSGLSPIEALKKEVQSLPDSGGTITFSKTKVLKVVSLEEWENIIKPKIEQGWDFSLGD